MEKFTQDKKAALVEALRTKAVMVSFKKVNGERRDMVCTLAEELLPTLTQKDNVTQARKENPAVQSVWDTTAKGWRSFRWENVIEFGEENDNN